MLDFQDDIEIFCDNDGCSFSQAFEGLDLENVVEDAKSYGWKIFKENGMWTHVCPHCEK